jgi:CheY-like chemotaxis protein
MKKILLVDDDMDLLYMLTSALKQNGYSVTALADGAAAIRAVETVHPDIIILDIHMPPVDGRDICFSLKNIMEHQHIPVVLYSALPEDKESITKCRADLFLQKPLSNKEFIEEIGAAMKS